MGRMEMTKLLRLGKCTKCGDCCRDKTLEARIQAYKEAGVAYELVNKGCTSFDPNTGLCKNYENRPLPCKQFPLLPVDIVALPKCGYSFIEPPLCPNCGEAHLEQHNRLELLLVCPLCWHKYKKKEALEGKFIIVRAKKKVCWGKQPLPY